MEGHASTQYKSIPWKRLCHNYQYFTARLTKDKHRSNHKNKKELKKTPMTTDSIRIIPAGHKTPPLQRRVVSDNGGLVWQIEKAHEKWQAKNPDKSEWSAAYQSAQYHTKGIHCLEQTSIDAFIIAHIDDPALLK